MNSNNEWKVVPLSLHKKNIRKQHLELRKQKYYNIINSNETNWTKELLVFRLLLNIKEQEDWKLNDSLEEEPMFKDAIWENYILYWDVHCCDCFEDNYYEEKLMNELDKIPDIKSHKRLTRLNNIKHKWNKRPFVLKNRYLTNKKKSQNNKFISNEIKDF